MPRIYLGTPYNETCYHSGQTYMYPNPTGVVTYRPAYCWTNVMSKIRDKWKSPLSNEVIFYTHIEYANKLYQEDLEWQRRWGTKIPMEVLIGRFYHYFNDKHKPYRYEILRKTKSIIDYELAIKHKTYDKLRHIRKEL